MVLLLCCGITSLELQKMLKIGHQHWLHTNLEVGSVEHNITDPFAVKFDIKAPVLNLDFNSAADYTAKLIADKYTNLHLCLSGGLDSEFVAVVLLRNQIPFVPVILSTRNNHESWYAFKFCDEHKLTPVVFDFTSSIRTADTKFVIEDLVIQIIENATALKIPIGVSLIPNIIVKLLLDPTANVLTGYGDPLHISDHFNDPIGDVFEITDHDCYLNLEYGDSHPGAFFTFTPEIFKAIIADIDVNKNSQISKSTLYGLQSRSKTLLDLRPIGVSLGRENKVYGEINKKFSREEHLKYVSFSRQQLLDML